MQDPEHLGRSGLFAFQDREAGVTAEQYRQYWAALTSKSPREIYVPKALREPEDSQFRETGT